MDLSNLDTTKKTVTIGDKYILQERLGSGSFGQIYSATNKANNTLVAVKLEQCTNNKNPVLNREAKVLSDLNNEAGFPAYKGHGKEAEYNYLAMSLLGFNLDKLLSITGKRFSMKTVLMLADQMLGRIETLHNKNFIHRDIKPENFCLGLGHDSHTLYLIDFGLARAYKEANGLHIAYQDGRGLIGTARFASVNAHLGIELSRRDDLESLGYTLVYLLKGALPWQGFKVEDKQKRYKMISDCKSSTRAEELCEGLPKEFVSYFDYVKSLGFSDEPNYKYMRVLFRTLSMKMKYSVDYQYDWVNSLNKYCSKKNNAVYLQNGSSGILGSGGPLKTEKAQKIQRTNTKAETMKVTSNVRPVLSGNRSKLADTDDDSLSMGVATECTFKDFPSTKIMGTRQMMFNRKRLDVRRKEMLMTYRSDDAMVKNRILLSQKVCGTYPDALSQESQKEKPRKRDYKCSIDVKDNFKKIGLLKGEENVNETSVCELDGEKNEIENNVQNKRFFVQVKRCSWKSDKESVKKNI